MIRLTGLVCIDNIRQYYGIMPHQNIMYEEHAADKEPSLQCAVQQTLLSA